MAIRGILEGEFLDIPFVKEATVVGGASLVMSVGLNILGFSARENVVTAAFTVTAAGGLAVTAIGMVAYSIIAAGFERGQREAWTY